MKKRSIGFLIVLIIIIIGAVVGYKMWNKPFKDPLKGDAIKVTASQLFTDFSANESTAQANYVPKKLGEKVIEVSGEVKEVGKNEDGETFYTLQTGDEMFGVKCIMNKGDEITTAKIGDSITVRGFCDGYNMDVIVNRCKIVK